MIPYLLDANVFIHGWKSTYRITVFGPVWDWIQRAAKDGTIASIPHVKKEVQRPHSLKRWMSKNLAKRFWVNPSLEAILAVREVVRAVEREPWYSESKFRARFMKGADPILIGMAIAHGHVLVTQETPETRPGGTKVQVKIPDVAEQFGVRCITTDQMLEELDVSF